MKKFLIQMFVLLVIIFGGLIVMFRPELLGVNPVIPGATPIPVSTPQPTVNQVNGMTQILFIDHALTGNPELVKSILSAEVADSPEERAQGLSYRDSMAPDSGMIFLFDAPSKVRFIMTGMRFPLDFIWVLDDKIVDLLENVPPDPAQTADKASHFYSPTTDVNKVIEVNAGYVKAHGLKVGDRIKF